ncbi:hypothetical protein FSARC_3927 [Fusarium sarcochroum]|uniref:Uncharacterized protein n=1 Tax=Fusarium sarcochroum TaxID=1208366 RepID=A0A8H4U3B7_9HYPO|nr:hypothetical protein FSARC_3927 [Fusarium sarcochroum]
MGTFNLFVVILAIWISIVVANEPTLHSKHAVLSVEVLPSLPSSFDPEPTKVVTVDCLFCSLTDIEESPHATTEVVTVTAIEPVSKTTICTQQCLVSTLVTVSWKSGQSKVAPLTPSAVAISCITIYTTTPFSSEVLSTSITASENSLSTSSTSCSTTSTNISPWTWPQSEISVSTELASSAMGIPPWTSAAAEASTSVYVSTLIKTIPSSEIVESTASSVSTLESTETLIETSSPTGEVSVSEPCTTEVTVTMTKTIVETWQSKTLKTATLVRTLSTTIKTVVVEAYSTSTGEVVVGGTKTETTTVEAVSDTECSEVGKCCAGCSVTVQSEGVETISSTLVETFKTVEEYVSSVGGSLVSPVEPFSGTVVRSGTDSSTPTTSKTITETTLVATEADSESETAGPTSVQTAGAAHMTAAVGIGAIFGLMGLLA